MPLSWLSRGALRKVAPFAFLGLGALPAFASPLCPADRIDEKVTVTYVFDGDTVKLSDGRRVRLIGIDTPEVGHGGAPAQPYAEEARATLQAKVQGRELGLRYDAERTDQYGRLLAHLYLPSGNHIGAELLASGLASTLVIPPNLWNQPCLAAQQAKAEKFRKGVWKLSAYRGVTSRSLKPDSVGVHRVIGRVIRVGESRKSLWLNLEGGLAVRIPRRDFGYFKEVDLRGLKGHRIAARGRIYEDAGRLQMTIQHPSALSLHP